MKRHKKLALALAIGAAITGTALTADMTSAAQNDSNVSVKVSVKQSIKQSTNIVNWYKGADSDIIADGIGRSGGKGVAMTRMAAIMDAQRNLLGIIKGVQIDSETLMEDLIVSSDVVRRKFNGLLKGAQIIEEHEREGDEYYVRMRVPIYGVTDSLASIILPEIRKDKAQEPFPTINESVLVQSEVENIRNINYTGVIINAGGLGMEPTFSPVIYDTEGRAVYGVNNLDYDKVMAEGMVDYSETMEDASNGSRAGNNPMIINAIEVKGGQNSTNKVNVVISANDADKMLLANESSRMLDDMSVVFVK